MSNILNSAENLSGDDQIAANEITVRELADGRREVSGEHFLVIGDAQGNIEDVFISDQMLEAMMALLGIGKSRR